MYPSGTPLILRNDLFLDRRDGTGWNAIVFIRSQVLHIRASKAFLLKAYGHYRYVIRLLDRGFA